MVRNNRGNRGPARSTVTAAAVVAALTTVAATARPARAEETQRRTGVGVGYKIGNGLGFAGGDVILRFIPHVVFDLQANYVSVGGDAGSATGYGFAPTVQGQLFELGHTPYLGLGFVYCKMTLNDAAGSGS